MRTTAIFIFPMFVLLLVMPMFGATPAKSANLVEVSTEMSYDQANQYLAAVVAPAIEQALVDPSYPVGIKDRLKKVRRAVEDGKLRIEAYPFFNPYNRVAMAHIQYDEQAKIAQLMLFIPAIQAQISTDSETSTFELAVMEAHEWAHSEVSGGLHRVNATSQQEASDNEALATGVTIAKMIEPAVKAGIPISSSMARLVSEFKKVRGNARDPQWVAAFAPR